MFVSACRRYVQSWLTRTFLLPARSRQPSELTVATGPAAERVPALDDVAACSMVESTPPDRNGSRFTPPPFRWITAGFRAPDAISLGTIGRELELAPWTATNNPTNAVSAMKP